VGITIFLTVFIFPKILPIFVSLRVELPASTKFIIALLTFIQQYGYYVIGGFLLFVIIVKFVLSIKKMHFYFDKFLLSVPFLSTTIINLTMTDFTRSLSVLLKSGMTIIDSLEISKGTFHNLYYRYQIDQVIEGVKRGETMARYLVKEPRLFPPMFTGMVQIGENTGNLESNLFYLSEYYESEVDDVIKNITAIIEPMLLLIMGLVVGFVAISIITPIYKITQGIQIK
ncbi:MAG: type II secretion system F family protein, partial [Patescibacteria group bacterium]